MHVTADTFDPEVLGRSNELPVVVAFWAGWYAPWHELWPAIESEAEMRKDRIALVRVDVDAEQALVAQHRIQSLPTVVVFVDGVLVTGFMGEQTAAFIGTFFDDVIAAHERDVPA